MADRSPLLDRRTFLKGALAAPAVHLSALRGAPSPAVPTLSLRPFLACPTTTSIRINVRNGFADALAQLQIREGPDADWRSGAPDRLLDPGQFADWTVEGLGAGRSYEYRVLTASPGGEPGPVATGTFTTQRVGEVGFDAAFITDAHTGSFVDGQGPIEVLDEVVRNVRRERPDFVVALGDNVAWPTSRNEPQANDQGAVRAYTMYRRHLAPLSGSCPHFGLIGNWEGESGKTPDASASLVGAVRRAFTPNPNDRTYPEGGSPAEDYYAFDWGPVLFIALNVQSYTTPSGERPDPRDDVSEVEDWTLGPEQLGWMEGVLTRSTHPFKFVCIHHAVGGNAANRRETLYGRGGHRAARVGEQRLLHEAMLDHGVQAFFYGHDHVFVHEVVDGIHYALPGSCGAPWKFGTEITGYRRYWGDSGHARLSVRPERATVRFVSQAGQVIHQFHIAPA